MGFLAPLLLLLGLNTVPQADAAGAGAVDGSRPAGAEPAGASTSCPPADSLLGQLERFGLERASRTRRFEAAVPEGLYRKALERAGRPAVDRIGKRGFAVLYSDLPVEAWWRAINADERHVGYLPIDHSQQIDGEPGADGRRILQRAQRFGVGRYWISRYQSNGELFRASEGALWELWFELDLRDEDLGREEVLAASNGLQPMQQLRGAWLLKPLGESCLLVEQFSWSEAGGTVGAFEAMALEGSMRTAITGMERLAREMSLAEGADAEVVGNLKRPDGKPLQGAGKPAAPAP
ncbi:hypothetical protein ABI59_18010 [Acidobacteria bacterium Mor1]|nr:hypothetical protein ABI59_18010 [Acidobacteria bacterium Mor1]